MQGRGAAHPEAIMCAACSDVASDVVVSIDQPVCRRCRVRCEPYEELTRVRRKIACNDVLGLKPVLYEVCVAQRLEGDVVLHAQVVNAMDGDCAVVRVVDRVPAHVRILDGAYHMKVDRVPSQSAHLARVAHLDVLNARRQ